MKSSTPDSITLELIARSPRVQPAWLDALPGWRDHHHRGKSLVDALIAEQVLHSPARQIVDLVARGILQARHVPVLITALGASRLGQVLDRPAPTAQTERVPSDYDSFDNGEFIPLDQDASDSGPADRQAADGYDQYSPGEFIAFDDDTETPAADSEPALADSRNKADWNDYDAGEFIAFDET